MADPTTSTSTPIPPTDTNVQPSWAAKEVVPLVPEDPKGSPTFWRSKLRPKLPGLPTIGNRIDLTTWDAFFAGAKQAGKWEDEWPLLTEKEFTASILAVGNITLGGQHPDGSHPLNEE